MIKRPGSRRSEHITPVVRSFYWLPDRQRVTFKCLNDQASTYLAEFCRQTGDRRSGMTSAETWILHVARAICTYGDRSFCCRRAKHLNNLPPAIRDPSLSSQGFRRLLKTRLFGRRSRPALVHLNWRLRNGLTYLLTYYIEPPILMTLLLDVFWTWSCLNLQI